MRVLFTGGGTGGHVYPALAVIERLHAGADEEHEAHVAWVGRPDSIEQEIVAREDLPFFAIRTGALRGRSPLQAVQSLVRLVGGIQQGRRLLKRWNADAVFTTGGYVTAPLTLAAWLKRVPVMIYLPDMEPGLAVRLLARFATRIAVSFESVARYFDRRKVFVSGYPVREGLFDVDRAVARGRLGLRMDLPVVLVLGGSSGARSINLAVRDHLEELLSVGQVVHVSGPADEQVLAERAAALPEDLRARYHVYGYLHGEMSDALGAADLVVARAGAATLAEFPAARLPAILVPYPYAGQHQRLNADFLVGAGGAVVVDDGDLDERLYAEVQDLLADAERRQEMAAAMGRVSVRDAADRLAAGLREMATRESHG